tara:strand:- start:5619 stop:6269 length:651 start_codon:yes stop_codon:yes gene_type:complete
MIGTVGKRLTKLYNYYKELEINIPSVFFDIYRKEKCQLDNTNITNRIEVLDRYEISYEHKKIIDKWLTDLKLPQLDYAVYFKTFSSNKQGQIVKYHIDYNAKLDCIVKCALNIPLCNCDDSVIVWTGSNYVTNKAWYDKSGKWIISKEKYNEFNIPALHVEQEVDDFNYYYFSQKNPYVLNTCIPHKALVGNKERHLISLRLKGNYTFEKMWNLTN